MKIGLTMMIRVIILGALVVTVALAAQTPSSRPRNCTPGTVYRKDCNTCTCGVNERSDRCSRINCARLVTTDSDKNKRPLSKGRPGTCPRIAYAPSGNTDCSRRTKVSECSVDKECSAAKKCCKDGCGTFLCRNAIYLNTP